VRCLHYDLQGRWHRESKKKDSQATASPRSWTMHGSPSARQRYWLCTWGVITSQSKRDATCSQQLVCVHMHRTLEDDKIVMHGGNHSHQCNSHRVRRSAGASGRAGKLELEVNCAVCPRLMELAGVIWEVKHTTGGTPCDQID
jgi:hypothetical protein